MYSFQLLPRDRFIKRSLILIAALISLAIEAEQVWATTAAQIYQQKCASCHGTDGGGVQDLYNNPLYGDESVDELAERIADTMPEDDPESCVGEEARQVAEYIYGEFYSEAARRAKGLIAAPRIELSRLTVPQYRNAVADLVASFTPPPRMARGGGVETAGLHGAYFQSDKMSKTDALKFSRVDPSIDFDLGEAAPQQDKAAADQDIDASQFAIIWSGSLQTRETGLYEFRVITPNGVRLYLNADGSGRRGKLRDDSSEAIQARLIDGWVSSGENRTLKAQMFLLGGRRYPIRVEFFKYQEPSASIRVEWKPPHGIWTLLDQRALTPKPAARTFVVDTPFPADDRSLGYERGSSVSQEWHTAVTNAALATTEEVVNRLPKLAGIRNAKNEQAKLAKFAAQFARIAFRRPLTAAEKQLYGITLFENATPESAIRRAVLLVLTSPHFLYVDLSPRDKHPSPHTIASRLAFALWDSLPDAELRRAANLGKLQTTDQTAVQAERMLANPKARAKMQGFFRHWLELEERDLAKDKHLYPDFNEAVIADLRRSLELFVNRVVWSPSSDYRELLQANYLLLNERLRTLYAQPASTQVNDTRANDTRTNDQEASGNDDNQASSETTRSEFSQVGSSTDGRAGILTHPYLLSAFAYHDNTSPIHRGVFLTRNIIGRQLKPPPVAVAFENNDFAPDLTMREKVTELTRDQACLSCHEVINPLGFALENFDAVGRWRTKDNNKPIDTVSSYVSTEGATVRFGSARDIANFAIESPVAHRAFITQLFQHLVKQSPAAFGPKTVDDLQQHLVADSFNIRKLLVRIATSAASYDPAAQLREPLP